MDFRVFFSLSHCVFSAGKRSPPQGQKTSSLGSGLSWPWQGWWQEEQWPVLPQRWPSVGVPDSPLYLGRKLAFSGFWDSCENPVRVFQCRVEMCSLIRN